MLIDTSALRNNYGSGVYVYPYIEKDWLQIDGFKNEVEISILNIQGQIVNRFEFQHSPTKVDIGNLCT